MALNLKTDRTMGKAILSLLVICLFFLEPICYAQKTLKVSDPRLELKDNKLHISYDILESEPGDRFSINIDIKDENGNTLNANSLSGDIGVVEEGGTSKRIIWDFEADEVYIDAYIYVKLNARIVPRPEPVVTDTQEETTQKIAGEDKAGTERVLPEDARGADYNRAGIILQSLAFPGLGLSRMTGKPHWIKGVAGYGCIAGSIVFNRLAVSNFNTIGDLDRVNQVTDVFEKSVQQDNISEILAYAAIGIWVTDFIWTLAGTSDLRGPSFDGRSKGLSIRSNIDPFSNTPLVGLRFRF